MRDKDFRNFTMPEIYATLDRAWYAAYDQLPSDVVLLLVAIEPGGMHVKDKNKTTIEWLQHHIDCLKRQEGFAE